MLERIAAAVDPPSSQDPAMSMNAPLLPWIRALSTVISHFEPVLHKSLIQMLLQFSWSKSASEPFVQEYTQFLAHLVSAHAHWAARDVAFELLRSLAYPSKSSCQVSESLSTDRIHRFLKRLATQLAPMITATDQFQSLIAKTLRPHSQQPLTQQKQCLTALLRLAQDIPIVREYVWRLLIEFTMELDLELGEVDGDDDEYQDQVFQFDDDNLNTNKITDDNDEENSDKESTISSFLDDDESVIDEDDIPFKRYNRNDPQARLAYQRQAAKKLDTALSLLLQTQSNIRKPTNVRYSAYTNSLQDVEHQHSLMLLDVFRQTILPTHQARYVQFILFHWCAKNEDFADIFIGTIIQEIVGTEDSTSSSRNLQQNLDRCVNAAGYVSSYVARAKYLPSEVVRGVVNVLTSWALEYVELDRIRHQRQILSSSDKETQTESILVIRRGDVGDRKHFVWYAVMQALMYIFCFRWKDLCTTNPDYGLSKLEEDADEEDDELKVSEAAWISAIPVFIQLLHHRLAPLRICSRAICQQFCNVFHTKKLAYLYPLMTIGRPMNKKALTEDSDEFSDLMMTIKRMETFFPFDPLKLPHSSFYIQNLYLEWEDVQELQLKKQGLNNGQTEDEEVDEEFDMENGMHAMSISPNQTTLLNEKLLREQLHRLLG